MVLIADPQIIDRHTYDRRGLSLAATIYYTDLFMSRSYRSILSHLNPSTILFLGDLFDGGREWASDRFAHSHDDSPIPEDPDAKPDWKELKDEFWLSEYSRFMKIFPPYPYRRTVMSLPGNHDLGVGNGIRESVSDRFKLFFGDTSRLVTAGNHSIVLLDTASLSNDINERIYGPPREFLDSLPAMLSPPPRRQPHTIQDASSPPPPSPPQAGKLPVILLTHIPLFRLANASCGPLRESPNPIRIGGGYQYINTLSPDLSAEILRKVDPTFVFSADDHDFCEVHHGDVTEVTVKSFAWTMGIRRPGFSMVSLYTGAEEKGTVAYQLCLLPDQIKIYMVYAFVALVSLVLVALKREPKVVLHVAVVVLPAYLLLLWTW